MKNLDWTFVDKQGWGEGPWQDEPDKIQWTDTETGLPCLIVRGPHGALCGYVGVDSDHPLYNTDYFNGPHLDVHGGLTFSDFCRENTEHGICHVTEPGDPDPVWWLGFDCAHSGDICPKYNEYEFLESLKGNFGETYKPISYLKDQCRKLAAQLAEIPAQSN